MRTPITAVLFGAAGLLCATSVWVVWPERADGGPDSLEPDAVSKKRAKTNGDRLAPDPSPRLVCERVEDGACQARLEEAESELRATRAALAELLEDRQEQEYQPYFVTDQDELLERAKRCELRTDRPEPLTPHDARELGLSSRELDVYNSTLTSLLEEYHDDYLAAQADELGMSLEEVRSFQSLPLEEQLKYFEQNPNGAQGSNDLHRMLAEERAGLREPPSDLSQLSGYERRVRLQEGIGDAFEHRLAGTLGKDRARELRVANGGWPGYRSMSAGCRDAVVSEEGGT